MQDHKIKILLEDTRGIYIPQVFYKEFKFEKFSLDRENYTGLSDPANESYWDTWSRLLTNAEHTDEQGYKWFLFQDGDLFLVREDYDFEQED